MAKKNPNPHMRDAKRWHGWFRFSLRTLLITIAAFTIWLGWQMNRAHKQRRAVAEITKVTPWVYYDYYGLDASGNSIYAERGPKWLRQLLGRDFFGRVTFIDYARADRDVTDDDLVHLEALPHIRSLRLSRTHDNLYIGGPRFSSQISDEGLKRIGQFSAIERLNLCGAPVTDRGLMYLTSLPNLRELTLCETRVTDAGLVHLEHIRTLVEVNLNWTDVSPEGALTLQNALPKCTVYE